jgi:ABC-type thiamin/hydroxymethylpyrimidine transport system permease subunit
MAEILGVLAAILSILSMYLIGPKKMKSGFLVGLCSNVIWILYVIKLQSGLGLLITSLVIGVFNIQGYLRWRKDAL